MTQKYYAITQVDDGRIVGVIKSGNDFNTRLAQALVEHYDEQASIVGDVEIPRYEQYTFYANIPTWGKQQLTIEETWIY